MRPDGRAFRKSRSSMPNDPSEATAAKRKDPARVALSVDEAATAFGVSPATVWRWVAERKLGTVKVGGRRLVPIAAIDALLTVKCDDVTK
jgi:excisionase family DNA binding protein